MWRLRLCPMSGLPTAAPTRATPQWSLALLVGWQSSAPAAPRSPEDRTPRGHGRDSAALPSGHPFWIPLGLRVVQALGGRFLNNHLNKWEAAGRWALMARRQRPRPPETSATSQHLRCPSPRQGTASGLGGCQTSRGAATLPVQAGATASPERERLPAPTRPGDTCTSPPHASICVTLSPAAHRWRGSPGGGGRGSAGPCRMSLCCGRFCVWVAVVVTEPTVTQDMEPWDGTTGRDGEGQGPGSAPARSCKYIIISE